MAMAIESRQQSQLGSLGFDPIRYPPPPPLPPPHFTNPWVPAAASQQQQQQQQLYSTSVAPNVTAVALEQPSSAAAMTYHGLPVTAPAMGQGIALSHASFATPNLSDAPQDVLSRAYTAPFAASAASSSQPFAPTSAPYSQVDYGTAYGQEVARRSSHPSAPSASSQAPVACYEPVEGQLRQSSLVDLNRLHSPASRDSFADALDPGRALLSLTHADMTPRNIYAPSSRGSTDSYGFPSTHSTHSSISSASFTAAGYYPADGSVTDYSSASESVDLSRTLPRPNALLAVSLPPAPQSMMGQFNSKMSSSSQKKHKCKICDKRFTRPSSLQTHMYSHTGEKPFACEFQGCGRHFSVVSNLRRHRKVHKCDLPPETGSPREM